MSGVISRCRARALSTTLGITNNGDREWIEMSIYQGVIVDAVEPELAYRTEQLRRSGRVTTKARERRWSRSSHKAKAGGSRAAARKGTGGAGR